MQGQKQLKNRVCLFFRFRIVSKVVFEVRLAKIDHFWSQDPYNRYVVVVVVVVLVLLGSIQKFCLKIAKIENCQNWKLLGLKIAKIASCQNCKLPKLQVAKIASCQNCKMPKMQVAKIENCKNCKLAKLKVISVFFVKS